MMNDRSKYQLMFDEAVAQHKSVVDSINYDELVDDDRYPTDYCLKLIEDWHWSDSRGWFNFIENVWYMKGWGWSEKEDIGPVTGRQVVSFSISTGGWSGNESIIGAMQCNQMMWSLTWYQSRRGGHYIFQLMEFENE